MIANYALTLDQDTVIDVYKDNYFEPNVEKEPLYNSYLKDTDTYLL